VFLQHPGSDTAVWKDEARGKRGRRLATPLRKKEYTEIAEQIEDVTTFELLNLITFELVKS